MLNPHPRDRRVRFEEVGHQYYIDGDSTRVDSVTQLISTHFEPFPAGLAIWRIQNCERYTTDPRYRYYLKSKTEIKQIWDNIRTAGSYNHDQVRQFFLNGDQFELRFWHNRQEPLLDPSLRLEGMFLQFYGDHMQTFRPFRIEQPIFEGKIAGTPDFIFQNKKTGKLVLGDFKFSYTLKENGGYGLGEFSDLRNNDQTRFALQVSFYRFIMEEWYGYEFEDQFVVLLHRKRKSYGKIELPYLKNVVQDMIFLFNDSSSSHSI